MIRRIAHAAALVLLPAACVFAQQPATTTSPAVEQLRATVTGVEGIVQVRSAEDQPWQKATVGMTVGQNAEFRTAARSAVRFSIGDDQVITLDRLGTVKVLQAVSEGGKLKTNLGMRYGRTRYDIEAAGREHESTISSPSSTLAVRGTKVSVFDQRPFRAEAVSLTGRAEFRDARKRVFFGGRNAGKAKVNTANPNAAAVALVQSVVDPGIALARTDAETALVESLLSRGATVEFDFDKGIRVVRGGTVPQNDNELIPTLPGTLNFVLRWTQNADLNLGVVTPGTGGGVANTDNTTIYPLGGFDVLANGGQTAFDHRGGANGGIEIAFWPAGFPDGPYRIGVQHMSGAVTPATIDVFRDGQRVPILMDDGTTVQTNTLEARPLDPQFGSAGQGGGRVRIDPPPGRRNPAAPPVQMGPMPAKKR